MKKHLELVYISVISIAATVMIMDNRQSVIDGGHADCGCMKILQTCMKIT